ncbi:MAG TPA: hypothetical protein VMV77_21510 [Bacteroidales bacterium]|nr:hypothetical protein [Bacteroidales bacterium]
MKTKAFIKEVFSKTPVVSDPSTSLLLKRWCSKIIAMQKIFIRLIHTNVCLSNYSEWRFMRFRLNINKVCPFLLGSILLLMVSAPAYTQILEYQAMALWGGSRSNFYDTGGTGLKNIDIIAASGANAVTLCINSRINIKDNESSFTSILDDPTAYTNYKKAALYARSKGLMVILKPFVLGTQGVLQNSRYCPPDGNVFFASVEHDLMNNVKLAKEVDAEMLIIGTEMGGKITSNHSDYGYNNCIAWHKIIKNIRTAAPKLKLTYSATMTNTWNKLSSNEAPRICFWDELDYIGLNAYPDMNNISPTASADDYYNRLFDNGNPISNGGDDGTANPVFSLSDFSSQYGITNQSWVKYIEFVTNGIRKLANKPNMQVILPEIGSTSTNNVLGYWGASGGEGTKTLNYTGQANGWDGVMKALATDKSMRSMVVGISIWAVEASHDPRDTTSTSWQKSFDVVGKPAYDVIKKWFTLPQP